MCASGNNLTPGSLAQILHHSHVTNPLIHMVINPQRKQPVWEVAIKCNICYSRLCQQKPMKNNGMTFGFVVVTLYLPKGSSQFGRWPLMSPPQNQSTCHCFHCNKTYANHVICFYWYCIRNYDYTDLVSVYVYYCMQKAHVVQLVA